MKVFPFAKECKEKVKEKITKTKAWAEDKPKKKTSGSRKRNPMGTAFNAVEEYVTAHGRQPSVTEIAKQFNLDEAETVFVMGSSKMPLSLYGGGDFKDGKERELIETLPSKDNQDDWLDNMLLRGAIESLSERDRKVIVLRYFRDMTQSEVARKIGVSQVQISRIENRIIKEFREKLIG